VVGVKGNRAARSLPADDAGAFPVVEAILVAVLVLTAIIFFTSVQRPSQSAEEGGIDLSQSAADTLALLKAKEFDITAGTPAPPYSGNDLTFDQWFTNLVAGDAATRSEVDDFLSDIVPTGADYSLRLSNGVDTLVLLPDTARPPVGARSSEVGVLPAWGQFSGIAATDGAAPGQPLSAAANPLLVRFTDPNAGSAPITCIRSPAGSGLGPGGQPWMSWWRGGEATAIAATAGTRTAGLTTLPVTSSANMAVGMWITGTGLAEGTTVASVPTATSITLSQAVTGSGSTTVTAYRAADASTTGTRTAGSPVLPVTSSAGMSAGMWITGTGIPAGTTIASVGSATQITLSQAATSGAATSTTVTANHNRVPANMPFGTWAGYTGTITSQSTCAGGTVAGYAKVWWPRYRTLSDGVVTALAPTVLTSLTAGFSALDAGLPVHISGQGTFRIASVTSSTAVVLSGAATAGTSLTAQAPTFSPYAPYGLQLVVWFGA
jgi:hypothetical protein